MAAAPQLDPAPLKAAATTASAGHALRRRPLRATDEVESAPPSILVVEPDERSRSLMQVGLVREGFDVLAAASAEEALRFLSPERPLPGMVFCEADLRGGDGFSLCGQIRADARTCDVPVVLLSRSPESYHREMAGGAGADQYLPKPVYLNDVIALARLMAGRSASAAQFDAHTDELPIAHALRALLSGVRSGRVELQQGYGWVTFREGQAVDASFDGLRGEDALHRLLLLGRGEYVVSFGPALTRATMTFTLSDLCQRTLPKLARWELLLGRCVPLEATLVVDFKALAQELPRLPDEVNTLVRLCDGRRRVRDVILESNLDEVVALEAVTRLYALCVLEPQPHLRLAVPAPASASAPVDVAKVLEPELQRQLDAFRIQPVVEAREPKPTPEPLSDFAQREVPEAASPDALEEAFFAAEGEPTADAPLDVASRPEHTRAALVVGVGAVLVVGLTGFLAFSLWPSAGAAPVAQKPQVVSAAAAPLPKVHDPVPPAPVVVRPAAAVQMEPLVASAEPASSTELAAESASGDVPAPLVEAISLYESGRYKASIALLEEITGADPSLTQAWLFLGLSRFDAGQRAQAENAALQALELDPGNGRALMLLASIYLEAGKTAEAHVELQRYLKLYPKGPFAREAKQLLGR